jgi:hypothetical protein
MAAATKVTPCAGLRHPLQQRPWRCPHHPLSKESVMYPYLHLIANTMGLVAWAFVYVMLKPGLQARGFSAHAQALLAPQMFRFFGLIALIPAFFDMRSLGFGDTFHAIVAWGDFTAGVLAMLAIVALRSGWASARALVWVFNIVGVVDLMHAAGQIAPRLSDPALVGPLGWIIFAIYLPMLVVSHIALFRLLLQPSPVLAHA